jgi:hypothetical protein
LTRSLALLLFLLLLCRLLVHGSRQLVDGILQYFRLGLDLGDLASRLGILQVDDGLLDLLFCSAVATSLASLSIFSEA